MLGADALRRLFGFIAFVYLARRITPADFGIVNIAFTVLSYGLMASSAGLTTLGARDAARPSSSDLIDSIVSLRIVLAVITYSCVFLIAQFVMKNALLTSMVTVMSLSIIVQSVLLEWFFQGREEMRVVAISRSIAATIYLIVVLVYVHSSADLMWVAVGSVLSDLTAVTVLGVAYKKFHDGRMIRFQFHGWKTMLTNAFSIGIGTMLGHFSIQLPLIIIGTVLTNADAGIYAAASKLVIFLLMFDRVFGTVLLPVSSRLHASSPEMLSSVFSTAMRWVLICALPVCVGGTLLADRLLPFVFGETYRFAVPVFQILIWYFFVTMVHTIYTSGLIAIGMERQYSRMMLMSFSAYTVTSFAGAILFGISGVAGAVVCSEIITLLLMRRMLHQTVKTHITPKVLNIVLSVVIMGVLVLLLPQINIILIIIIGGISYSAVLFATKTITPGELAALMKNV